MTKYHQFLRTDNLTDITEEDKNFLLAYGLQAVIDLREERKRSFIRILFGNIRWYRISICRLSRIPSLICAR